MTQRVDLLLVEDSPADLELALHVLRRYGLADHVHIVKDGAEALEFLFPDPADDGPASRLRLILLDLKLPKVNGLEVLRRIKEDPQLRRIPVVMLTSSREERDVASSYQLGANSYLVKPVEFETFNEMIRQASEYWLNLNHPPGD